MNLFGAIVCGLLILNGAVGAEVDDDSVAVEVPKVIQRRRKVKQIRPHWASQTGGDHFRATTFSDDGSYWNNNNQFNAQNYAAYGGTPPWNYGNQQGSSTGGQQGGQQSTGYYPPTGGQGQNQGSSGSQQPQPGYPSPGYPTQTGFPQPGQPGYPQGPAAGPSQPGQPGYPQGPPAGPSQPGYPQRPQPGYPQGPQTGYPQRPQPGQPAQPGYPQRPGRPGSQPGTFQPPSPPGSEPPLPQRPPDNQVFPGSPFYPQIQPGLPGPPEGELESELKKYCRAPRGQFAVDTSCNKFVNCWDDVVVEQECPNNLVFSEEKKYCDFPENVNCGTRPYTQRETTGHDGNCSSPFATYRSSTNCGEFFVCSHGVPNRFVCPGGLAYNTDLGICDYAHRVECNGVPVLPVEETSEDPDYQGEYGNTNNENNYGSGNNNGNTNYGSGNGNGNYYGSYGSSGTKPYGRAKISDEDIDESQETSS